MSVAAPASPSAPIRVYIVSLSYLPRSSGYAIQASRVTGWIRNRSDDFEFAVVTRRFPGQSRQEQIDGVTVYRLGSTRLFSLAPRLSYFQFLLLLLPFLLRHRERFDVLHCISAYSIAGITGIAGRALRKATLVKVIQDELRERGTPLGNRIRGLRLSSLRLIDAFAAISTEIYERLRALGVPASRIHLIPNGVDTETFKPVEEARARGALRTRLGLPPQGFIITFVGLIESRKGVESLVDAWLSAVVDYPSAHLVLIGSSPVRAGQESGGALKTRLQEKIEAAGRANSVSWTGQVATVHDYLAASDLFVLPSLAEGLPNALLEAMATGIPCIATDIGGVRDIIDDGVNGLMIPAGNSGALEDALKRVLGMPVEAREAMGVAARRTIVERFSLDVVGSLYETLYRTLARDPSVAFLEE